MIKLPYRGGHHVTPTFRATTIHQNRRGDLPSPVLRLDGERGDGAREGGVTAREGVRARGVCVCAAGESCREERMERRWRWESRLTH